eukprot:175447-Chlamydomonas_euryale.AAC.2
MSARCRVPRSTSVEPHVRNSARVRRATAAAGPQRPLAGVPPFSHSDMHTAAVQEAVTTRWTQEKNTTKSHNKTGWHEHMLAFGSVLPAIWLLKLFTDFQQHSAGHLAVGTI